MSRSKRAWTESCAPLIAAARGAGEEPGGAGQACLARGPLFGAASSTKRLVILLAAGALFMGASSAPARAESGRGSHGGSQTEDPGKPSAHLPRAGVVALALGNGYASGTGGRDGR
jgi:hypothetical protein